MESLVSYSRGLQKHSLSIMKQGRSGYEPSDTETELQDAPWNEFNKRIAELASGVPKISSDEANYLNPSRLTKRHSSKFDPEGLPPPRRHIKSPYKTRRDDGSSRSPTSLGPLPLPPGRNISLFSKSERMRHVSPFKPMRGDDLLENDDEAAGSYNKPKHRQFNTYNYHEGEKLNYARILSAPRLRSRDKDQQIEYDQRLKRIEERSRTPPLRRSIIPRKDRESNHKYMPSVGEINEMVENATLAKSPLRRAPVFDNTYSLPGGDIFFSRDYAAVSAQM